MKKYLFFDLDGTLTESRTLIKPEMEAYLNSLMARGIKVIVISGADKKQIKKQLGTFQPTTIMWQSGAMCKWWKQMLTEKELVEVRKHIRQVEAVLSLQSDGRLLYRDTEDLVQERGAQVSYSILGHHADLNAKLSFDPDGKFRTMLLGIAPFFSTSIEVRIGGTTCLDYTHKEYTKGKNIQRFINASKWLKEDCVFYGDSMFKGGNDESVMGIIDTVEVVSDTDLLEQLKKTYGE